MRRTRVKICGLKERAGVTAAVAGGADAVGFILAEASPRYLEPEQVRRLIRTLPPMVDAVGVFVNEEASVVREIVQYCGLTMVQLHGEESPGYCAEMEVRVIKAFRVSSRLTAAELASYAGKVCGFLLDSYHEQLAGGTGRPFDWQRLVDLKPPGPVILAGGLGPDNVAEAILRARPFAVDVNSGVEESPGKKDPLKLANLFQEVARADRST